MLPNSSSTGPPSSSIESFLGLKNNLDVSENSGTPKSSTLIGVSIINHPFWGTPIFGNTHFQVSVCFFHSVLALLGFFLPLSYLSFLLSKYPTPTKSGKKYDAMTSTIARNSAWGKTRRGSNTSPAKVEALSLELWNLQWHGRGWNIY